MENSDFYKEKLENSYTAARLAIIKHKELYVQFLQAKLKELGLDRDVIRKDGVRGRILIIKKAVYGFSSTPYEYEFHPFTKDGSISKLQSGCIHYAVNGHRDSILTEQFSKIE